jgi:hypothetical protein
MANHPLTAPLRALVFLAPLLLATGTLPEAVHAAVTVDCSKAGQTIGKKIQPTAKFLEIIVKGNCVENLEIERDDVLITTAGNPASITAADPARPAIQLDGAHRIAIDGLTIAGGSTGVTAARGSSLDLVNCVVQGNSGNGVASSSGSTVTLDGCTVQNNGGSGVVAANAASLAIINSVVTGHASGSGIVAIRSADVRVGQNFAGVLGAVTVSNNGGGVGFSVTENSAGILVGGTVSGNGRGGVFVGRGSGAMIGIGATGGPVETTITGNQGIGINMEGGNATIVASKVLNNTRFGIHLGDGGNGRIGILPTGTGIAPNTISGNGSTGILVRGGSASIAGNQISGNGTNPADSLRHGVLVTGGHADLPGENTISNHPVRGVLVSTGGNALIGDPNYSGIPSSVNTITGSGTDASLALGSRGGVLAYRGSAIGLTNAEISGNSGTGVMAAVNSTLDVTGSTVKTSSGDGIWLNGHGYMRMRNPSVVDGNAGSGIRVARDSGAEFFGYTGAPPRVTGNALGLNCTDTESSVWAENNDFAFVAGNGGQHGMGNCTGF